jgi:AcrR family transcriptional regulator
MTGQDTKPATRSTYRHGDLRRALLEAGIALAQIGGPDAVVLREATRRAGVVPNAAYRHFASRLELLRAVRMAALSRLALSMEAELDALSSTLGSAELARASLNAIGLGYLHFALTETGLFRTIFAVPYDWPGTPDPAKAGSTGLNPSSCWAWRSIEWSTRTCYRRNDETARSISPGRPSMASPCWSSKDRCATSPAHKPMSWGGVWWIWSRKGFSARSEKRRHRTCRSGARVPITCARSLTAPRSVRASLHHDLGRRTAAHA